MCLYFHTAQQRLTPTVPSFLIGYLKWHPSSSKTTPTCGTLFLEDNSSYLPIEVSYLQVMVRTTSAVCQPCNLNQKASLRGCSWGLGMRDKDGGRGWGVGKEKRGGGVGRERKEILHSTHRLLCKHGPPEAAHCCLLFENGRKIRLIWLYI